MTNTREEKIKAIYEKIADKTLSFGCKVSNQLGMIGLLIEKKSDFMYIEFDGKGSYALLDINATIIGHPVLIGDILQYIDNELFRNLSKYEGMYEIDIVARNNCIITLFNYYIGYYRKPIENQSDDCIDYIYNLIQEKC